MSFAARDQERRATLAALAGVEPERYARERLGTLHDDPQVAHELRTRLAAGWDPLAAVDEVLHRAYRRLFELALAHVGPQGRILDWGAGQGSLVNFERDYASLPNPIVAVDKHAPPAPFPAHVTFVQSDLHAFAWDGPRFDLALALHVLEQLPDTPALLAKLRALLRPGGLALIAIPDGRFVHDLLKWLYKGAECDEVEVYTRASFDALASAAGFELVHWTCWPSYFSIHFGHVPLPGGRNLGELLDRLARDFDHAHGTQAFSCYGYALGYVAR